MKIVFDNIIYSLQKIGGNSVYWTELLSRFERDFENQIEYVEYDNALQNHIRKNISLNNLKKRSAKLMFFKRYFPVFVDCKIPFVFHSSYYRIINNRYSKTVVTVHDFIYEKFDSGLRKWVHSFQKKQAIKQADIVICISNSTKNDLLSIYPQFREKDIRVVYNGVGDGFHLLENRNSLLNKEFPQLAECRYVLVVGNRVGCKNFKLVANTFNRVCENYSLVLVGKPLSAVEYESFTPNSILKVHVYTGLSDENLNVLYNNAFCLFFPSIYEGFGIPVIEAMKAGCPVITTAYSSLPEICNDAALYLRTLSVDESLLQLNKLEDYQLRNNLILKGLDNAKEYSWEKTYQEVLCIYRELLK